MSMFRSKKLDLGCFVNVKVIRDHTKRKVFAEHETERYVGMRLGCLSRKPTGLPVLMTLGNVIVALDAVLTIYCG
jgi:hypothetical protein